jgi:hypothetical protein
MKEELILVTTPLLSLLYLPSESASFDARHPREVISKVSHSIHIYT